jgi:nicotinate-nucleotide adenylyltransferase
MHMRVGIMGGTFDPIHIGHLVAASEVCTNLELDEVIFIPAGEPWQKLDRKVSAAKDRLAMVQAAVKADNRFRVEDIEICRSGPTYAVDTMRDLNNQHPENEYFWIVGDDVLTRITTWNRWQEFLDLVHVVAVNRESDSEPEVPFEFTRVIMSEVRVSATALRERLAAGDDCRYLIPDATREYIKANGIYEQ